MVKYRMSQTCINTKTWSKEAYIYLDKELIIALVAMAGTLMGSFGGIITSSKLTSYRLGKLEEKVDKHNSFAERMPVVEEKIKVLNHRVEDIENITGVNAKTDNANFTK